MKFRLESCEVLLKRTAELNLVSDTKRGIPKFGTVFTQTGATYGENIVGQKHKRFREFRTPFPLRDIRENPRSNVRACAAADGAICSKNSKIVPYRGADPNTLEMARAYCLRL